MNFYATLEEAIDITREVLLAGNPNLESDDASVQQLSVQKHVLQDGDIMRQAEFFADESDVDGECLPILDGEVAQNVFDGDYDEIETHQEQQEENMLHEQDEGEFQLEPPLDTEKGQTAADEWDERQLLVRPMMYIEQQQQRIKHQRRWQIEDSDVMPYGVPNIPLHVRVVLVSVSLPWDGTANNTAASAREEDHYSYSQYSHLLPHDLFYSI